jgi:hypothetical protein
MQPFDKNMLKLYLRDLKIKHICPDKDTVKKKLINQLHTDIELNVKSPNYYDSGIDNL